MGGEQSTASGQLYNPKEYEFAAQDGNTRYGSVKIFKKLNEEKNYYEYVCQIDKTLNIESEFESQISHAEGRKKLSHPSLVNFINYTADKKEEFCSTFYKVQFLYEFVDQDLKKQIQLRRQQDKRYTESELWYILAQSISGFRYLKEQEIFHGDIRPYHILFTDEGELKIGEHFQQVKPLTAYNQFQLQLRNEEYYLSPEIFSFLRDRQITEVFDVASNDVFALGMTVLEAATLANTDDCYNTDDYEFRYEKLDELLHEVHHHYSHAFVEFLEKMLGEREGQKWTMEDLSAELQQLRENALVERDLVNKIEIIYEEGQEPYRPPQVEEGENQVEGEVQEGEQPIEQQQVLEGEQQQVQEVEQQQQEVAPQPGQQIVREQVYVQREETHYHREEQRTIINGVVQEDAPEEHEHVKRAGHHHHHDHQQAQPQQQEMTQQQPLLQSETYDLKEIDDRINQVLAMSRETVKKYGGARAYQAYEQYENSKGYEPVRGSQLASPTYQQQIYTPNQNVINSSQSKEQAPTQSYQPITSSQTQQVYDNKASSGYQPYQPPATTSYKPYQPSGNTSSSYQPYTPAQQQGSQQVEQLIDSAKKEANQVTSNYQPYQPPAAQQ